MRMSVFVLLVLPVLAQGPWVSLFDGKSLAGWRAPIESDVAAASWTVTGGALAPLPVTRKADLWSAETYRNFELEFEFRVAPGSNGGIKYLVQEAMALRKRGDRFLRVSESNEQPGDWYLEATGGLEFQIVDDATDEARNPKRRTAAIYQLVAPRNPPPVTPARFHRGRIVVNGDSITHELDGRRVLSVRLGSPEMDAAWAECTDRYIQRMKPLPKRETPVVLTHHDTRVEYRKIRIRRLP